MQEETVVGLYIYPVKSLPAVSVDSIELDSLGARGDRRYMLVDDNGGFISHRVYPAMNQACVSRVSDSLFSITLPELGTKELPVEGECESSLAVTMGSDSFEAFDQGDEWSQWFSQWLGFSVRLVYMPEQPIRRIASSCCKDERYVGFTDGLPLSLINQESLESLSYLLGRELDATRFRPNIVIKTFIAFEEDYMKTVSMSDAVVDVVRPCLMSPNATVDPETGEEDSALWDVMTKHCTKPDGNIYFGQYLLHQGKGTVTVGEVLLSIQKELTWKIPEGVDPQHILFHHH